MRKITLTNSETDVLEKIARRSKMDCWFKVNDDLSVRERDVKTLVEGITPYDVETLSPNEIVMLTSMLYKLFR